MLNPFYRQEKKFRKSSDQSEIAGRAVQRHPRFLSISN